MQSERINITENKIKSRFSAKHISFTDINFRKVSKSVKENEVSSNIILDNNFAGPSVLSKIDETTGVDQNMSNDFESNHNSPNTFEYVHTNDILDELDESLHLNQEYYNEFLNNSAFSEDIRCSSDEEINQKHDKFPNEAYADLMLLVTKHNLSNAAGNAIISFFNKHSNHSISPLPKNIKQGKDFMNNIKSNLSYKKTKVLDLDNTEYFLYHMPLISCIENILENSDISQNLEYEYKELYKATKVYITFNIICKFNIYFVFY
jgi:hypothetical protein